MSWLDLFFLTRSLDCLGTQCSTSSPSTHLIIITHDIEKIISFAFIFNLLSCIVFHFSSLFLFLNVCNNSDLQTLVFHFRNDYFNRLGRSSISTSCWPSQNRGCHLKSHASDTALSPKHPLTFESIPLNIFLFHKEFVINVLFDL